MSLSLYGRVSISKEATSQYIQYIFHVTHNVFSIMHMHNCIVDPFAWYVLTKKKFNNEALDPLLFSRSWIDQYYPM